MRQELTKLINFFKKNKKTLFYLVGVLLLLVLAISLTEAPKDISIVFVGSTPKSGYKSIPIKSPIEVVFKNDISDIDKEKVTQFYADIRRESNVVGGISIAVRHIESVLRMSEAHAKMHLRDYVRADDIDSAIDMLLESFLQSQKVSVAR